MAVKKSVKPTSKTAKKAPVKPAAKKAVAKKSASKAPLKKAVSKPAEKKSAKAKPAPKTITKKVTTKESDLKSKKTAVTQQKKSSEKNMAKHEAKEAVKATVKGKKFNKPVEELPPPPPKPIAKPHKDTSNLVKKVDHETAARFSSKFAIGDVTKFQLKIPAGDLAHASIEDKLKALFQLQQIDSEIDRIRNIRGELPIEVNDLEDDVAGLQTRIGNYNEEAKQLDQMIGAKKQAIKDSTALIKKYESQQNNVKNNREFESLNKEIEFQKLEIQLSEKRIKEYTAELAGKKSIIDGSNQTFDERSQDLNNKKSELDNIIAETQKEEEILKGYSEKAGSIIEERLLSAYKRIRENASNGLAVVTIQRDACGGCFNKIPPQRQLDIRQRKKVIVCEHCGRVLVDPEIIADL